MRREQFTVEFNKLARGEVTRREYFFKYSSNDLVTVWQDIFSNTLRAAPRKYRLNLEIAKKIEFLQTHPE